MSENASQSPSLGLYGKMAKIMGEMQHIPKNGTNSFFGYKFASEGDISDAVRNKLSAYNIALFSSMTKWSQSQFTTAKGKTSNKTICEFEFTLVCADSGTSRTSTWCAEADDEQDKGFNKAATGAMKYWLLKTFMIPTGDDPDADNGKEEKGKGKTEKWPTTELVGGIIKGAIDKLGITTEDVKRYSGIANLEDVEAWNKYTTRNDAAKAIKEAYDKHMAEIAASKPATPKTLQPYLESDLHKVVINMIYGGNEYHMKNSIKKLLEAKTLTPDMTLEQAVKVIEGHKARKLADSKIITDDLPANEPVKDTAYYAELEAQERRNARTALNGETITIYKVTYKPSRNGQGLPRWEALAHDINGASIPVVAWGEHVKLVEKAGHKWPKTDGENLDIPVMTELDGKDRHIKSVMALDGTWMTIKPSAATDESQQMFNDLPGMSQAAKNQLEHA